MKCSSTCQRTGVKVLLYIQTHALAFFAWLLLLDNIQNLAKRSGLSAQIHALCVLQTNDFS